MMKEFGTIVNSFEGKEYHGILTVSLTINCDSCHQGFGGLALDQKLLKSFKDDLCGTFGVKKLKDLVGRSCTVLRCFDYLNEPIEGLEAEDGVRFTITAWRRKHFPKAKNRLEEKRERLVSGILFHERQINEDKISLSKIDSEYVSWE